MTAPVAIIDATDHDEQAPVDLQVAGLGLVERTLRLAAVAECHRAIVLHRPETESAVGEACNGFEADDNYTMSVEQVAVDEPDSLVATFDRQFDGQLGSDTTLLALSSTGVYERGPVTDQLESFRPADALTVPDAVDVLGPVVLDGRTWQRLADHPINSSGSLVVDLLERADHSGLPVRTLDERKTGWRIEVEDAADADRAAEKIWQGCIKPIDGPISRHLNRPISLAISRWLAPTDVTPNQMSAVTFAIGLAATVAVAAGGYWWFLAGALLYQLSSILDGVDGELARGKYEFSVIGEWIDTLCDNTKDIVFYLGLGYGASQTVPVTTDFAGPDLWIWLGTAAATGKFLSLAGYATWLIPRGRGCVLIFDWGDEEGTEDDSLASRLFDNLNVLSKNDVVIFAALVLAVAGGLHWFLAVMAVGHYAAAAAIIARLASPEVDIVPESSPEPERVQAEK